MKKVMTSLLILLGLMILMAFVLGQYSRHAPKPGFIAGQLRACPNKPNCVCSEAHASDAVNMTAPIAWHGLNAETAWAGLATAINDSGGVIQRQNDTYLHATFTSRLFRFVDDVEARLDADNKIIHIRSASRVGHSDLGVNRKRVEAIRAAFTSITNK